MESLEMTGKTVDEAVNEALKKLKVEKDEVEITVIDEGAKGFLGIGAKPAKVSVSIIFDPVKIGERFIREVAAAMGMTINVKADFNDGKHLFINVTGENLGVLIGKRGQTLDSLQYLINLVVNRMADSYISVTLDMENYRERRKETLESLVYSLAKKVKQTRKSVVLEPMSPYERRIIHSALQHDRYVTTYSEGEEPYRNIVIALKQQGK